MVEAIGSLPTTLRRTLTWDQGREMSNHFQIAAATELDIYFYDPHSPWPLRPGSAARTRTPMACSASTFPRPPIYPAITVTTWPSLPASSIVALARGCPGERQPRRLISCCASHPVLLGPLESAPQYTSIAVTERLAAAGVDASVGSVGDAYDTRSRRP
jgi:hypothetical protein